MNLTEKLNALAIGISPDTAPIEVLEGHLLEAEAMILNKMYPFGYQGGIEVPPRYERLAIKLAIELYTKRGAEGQASHSENGVTRTWPTVNSILSQVIPHVGSVMTDA